MATGCCPTGLTTARGSGLPQRTGPGSCTASPWLWPAIPGVFCVCVCVCVCKEIEVSFSFVKIVLCLLFIDVSFCITYLKSFVIHCNDAKQARHQFVHKLFALDGLSVANKKKMVFQNVRYLFVCLFVWFFVFCVFPLFFFSFFCLLSQDAKARRIW